MHLCRIFSLYPHSYQDMMIDRLSWRIEWVYLMAYQAKPIEEGLWRIFPELFHCIHIHIKIWWLIDSHEGSNKFIWWLIKPNSLKKIRDASLQNVSIVSRFVLRCGDWSTLMEDWMSLSDCLSNQTYWRKFVMHLCKTFPLFLHSHQDVVIDRLSWRIKWVYLMAYQAKLIEEGWRIFCRTFCLFSHSYQNVATK